MADPLPVAVRSAFVDRFGGPPAVLVRAPGRVNLIGDHTDYNDGFVLPLAIERAAWLAVHPREDRRVRLWSRDRAGEAEFDLDRLERAGDDWSEYVKGVAWALQDAGHRLRGWEGVVGSDVPIGAGLSSSAALELAAAFAFAAVSDLAPDGATMARLAQRAENDWVGMNCGIMDPLISAVGEAGHAVLIDCRSLSTTAVPLPVGAAIVVLDTATRRGLVDSAYNERRRQCEAAASFFGVPALRDVSAGALHARAHEMEPVILRRARHVVTENERVRAAAQALCGGDAPAAGALMDASHASLRDDFEVSSAALDAIVGCARAQPGCLGARMTGAGFGGCAVALVETAAVPAFLTNTGAAYTAATGHVARIFETRATDGAEIVDVSRT